MDPLTALSVAASVLQFVDFGAKLVGAGLEIYKSKEGATEQNLELEYLTKHTDAVVDKLNIARISSGRLGPSDASLQGLAERCRVLSTELVDLLATLKGAQSQRTWVAIRQALKVKWNEGRIEALRKRLDVIKSEISLQLLVMLSTSQSSFGTLIAEVNERCRTLQLQRDASLAGLQQRLAVFDAQLAQFDELCKTFGKSDNHGTPAQLDLGSAVEEADELARQLPILDSLAFLDMPQREVEITEAFSNTYSWIFLPHLSAFASWLAAGSGTFWISGNPGSGKSTLMKFIANQDGNLRKMLESWADGKTLILSKHFFWGTGTALQKSYRGLLQGLLYQIFREKLDLVQHACPERWEDALWKSQVGSRWDSQRLSRSWDEVELKETLDRAILKNASSTAFCFFIDGLDEFAENHFSLITDLIRHYTARPNVKFCVSSRPYPVFSRAFATCPSFALQEMNGHDIDVFVRGKLEEDPRFQELAHRDAQAVELATEIRRRAVGVFLWVHLVVTELMSGLNNEDDFLTLRRRLDLLPKTLKEFFEHIVDSVEPVYQVCTARSLMLAHRAREPLPILTYAFLYDHFNDESSLSRVAIQPLSRQDIQAKRKDVSTKVSSWCRGLMQVVTYDTSITWAPLSRYRVDFLHRSVRDFLETSEMQSFLQKRVGSSFYPEEVLAHLFLTQAKVVDVQKGLQDEMQAFDFMATQAQYYAKLHETTNKDRVGASFVNEIHHDLEKVRLCLTQQNSALQVPHRAPREHSRDSSASSAGRRRPLRTFFAKLRGS
ncbi:uncharacterized protein MYCGRDRAFT_71829 [Zymoseptoria tritici IPO323]|uniref:Uncharacterized protein n=1 Tax=Zymoseptoria tritici (strain CBS 115943 / IPO323) TaxID=336722 RepID=F9XAV6_ZYMTI|nr:uncharacterized protein MYCGRDRAFT_71829 [Zymoseptoria tritici IPO323]EGP87705.1 hypothetical protein MYCGRDRAFT_71829 [Zymoseptoria tritici IPO323]